MIANFVSIPAINCEYMGDDRHDKNLEFLISKLHAKLQYKTKTLTLSQKADNVSDFLFKA